MIRVCTPDHQKQIIFFVLEFYKCVFLKIVPRRINFMDEGPPDSQKSFLIVLAGTIFAARGYRTSK